MKTPREKAIELVKKMESQFFMVSYGDTKSTAEQCAIYAVDEILLNFRGLHKPEYCKFDAIGKRKFNFEGEYDTHMTGYDMISYWEEVKSEIEKR